MPYGGSFMVHGHSFMVHGHSFIGHMVSVMVYGRSFMVHMVSFMDMVLVLWHTWLVLCTWSSFYATYVSFIYARYIWS